MSDLEGVRKSVEYPDLAVKEGVHALGTAALPAMLVLQICVHSRLKDNEQ